MAVKKAVAGSLVAVSTAGVIDLVGVTTTRRNRLRIDVTRVRVSRFKQPLMGVKVEHMGFGPYVQVSEPDPIIHVGVIDIRRVVAVCRTLDDATDRISRDRHRRIAIGPRLEEELLELAFSTVPRRTISETGGEHGSTHTPGAVIDGKGIANTLIELVLMEHGVGLGDADLVVEDDHELTVRISAGTRWRSIEAVLAAWNDQRGEVGVDRVQVVIEDPQQRLAAGIGGVVVDLWRPVGVESRGR